MGLLDFLTGKGKQTASTAPATTPPPAAKAEDKPAAAGAPAPGTFYVVKEGDTLWKIAETQYGAGKGAKYQDIFEANRPMLTDPDKIHPGQRLRIPELGGPAASAGGAKVASGGWVPPEEIRKG